MPSDRYLRFVEFVLWVVTVSATIIAVSLVLGLIIGRDLITGKYILFVVGFLLFGVGSLLLQPSRPRGDRMTVTQPNTGVLEETKLGSTGGSEAESGTIRERAPGLDTLRDQLGAPSTHQHRFEAKIQTVGPLADHSLPFQQRIGREYKIFVTGLLVLAFSLAMELVGVHV